MHQINIDILCTRPLNHDLIHVADKMGFRIDIVPFIKTEALDSEELTNRVGFFSFQAITAVFTSMNAADEVTRQLNGLKPLWRIFCLGNTTRNTLIRYFGEEAIAGFANNASALAHTINNAGNVSDVVFFCGDQRRDELPFILTEKTIHVEEVIVYKTVILTNKIDKEYQGILFFSPSAVSGFFSQNTIPMRTVLFAIGETTAASIKEYCKNTIVVADEPGKEGLVNKMIEFFQSTREENLLIETEE